MSSALPHRTRIKICGLTREQDVDAAVEARRRRRGFCAVRKSPRARDARAPPSWPAAAAVRDAGAAVRQRICATKSKLPAQHVAGPSQFHGDETPRRQCEGPPAQGALAARRANPAGRATPFDLVKFASDSPRPRPSCSTPMSTVTAAAERHSIGHGFHQASTAHLVLSGGLTPANVTDGIRWCARGQDAGG